MLQLFHIFLLKLKFDQLSKFLKRATSILGYYIFLLNLKLD